jgi:predicted PurR-regulated permease PerM
VPDRPHAKIRKRRSPTRALPRASDPMVTPPAVTVIAVILTLAAVQYAKPVLIPVVMAVLLFFVFAPVQRKLVRWGVNGSAAALVVVLVLLFGIASIFFLLSGPVTEVVENLPAIMTDISIRLESARDALLATAQGLTGANDGDDLPDMRFGSNGGADAEGSEDDMLLNTASAALLYLAEAPAMVAQVFLAIILLFFLLSSSDTIYLKVIQSFDAFQDKRTAFNALREVEQKLGGYLGTVALINAGLGVSVGLAMWALGMPVPLLFGVLAFILNFIPFIGSALGVLLASAVALLWFDTLPEVALVTASYLILTSLEGQLVTPALLARRFQMNTALVVVAIAFWAWMWSFMGMVIAVPILVGLRVIAEQVPRWRKLANLLSA